jgi:small conductance mechanosensitive channel
MILISLGLYRWQCRLRAQSLQPIYSASPAAQPLASQLNQQQHRNLKEVQRRLFQLAQAVVWEAEP